MFIPGPTEVFSHVRDVMSRPIVSHRGPEIAEVTSRVFDNLRRLFRTENECYVATSAATGLMEGAVRNLVREKMLCVVCGAFSERQQKVAEKCGKTVDTIDVDWGRAVDLERLEAKLAEGGFDVVACVFSETSTGILNPIREVGEIVAKFDDVMLVVDCVSAIAGAPFLVDDWGVDVAFAGTQKCLALPPGLCVFTVSPRAMERAATVADRGHYFDFLNYRRMAQRDFQIPATTNIPLVFALDVQLRRILDDEGLENRWRRHDAMATLARRRLGNRFDLFPDKSFMTPTETVFRAGDDLDVAQLVQRVDSRGMLFGNGYGALKGKTFRIGHMGDLQPHHLETFLDVFEEELGRL